MVRTIIGIITYRRPGQLRRLLESMKPALLEARHVSDSRVVVADNDPEKSAEQVTSLFAAEAPCPVDYLVVRNAGIPFARNAILDHLPSNAHYLAFVDDDETVPADWLVKLIEAMDFYNPDVLTGLVKYIPDHGEEFPPHLPIFEVFQGHRRIEGMTVASSGTGNTLLRVRTVKETGIRFDERLAQSGGSDSLYFHQLSRAGLRIIYSGKPFVWEHLPMERVNLRWCLRRSFRVGNTAAIYDRILSPGLRTRTVRALKGCYVSGRAVAGLPFSACFGAHSFNVGLCRMARGLGMLNGVMGRSLDEYQRS